MSSRNLIYHKMLANYIRLALRSLAKDKVRATIEVLGLALGLACCLLILLFVRHEMSFDNFHSRSDDIYRAWVKEDYGPDRQYFNAYTPIVLAEALERSVPGVERTVRLAAMSDQVTRGDARFTEAVLLADSAFFQVFDFNILIGNAATALSDPHSAVITEQTAQRLFSRLDVVGESFSIRFGDRFVDFSVAAVTARPPANSSIQYEIVVPFAMAEALYPPEAFSSWFNVVVETYVLISPANEPAQIEAQFPKMLSNALGDSYERSGYAVGLQRLDDIHFGTDVPPAIAPVSDPAYSYILGAIALLILLVACINYMTLSIGRSAQRAIEVGVRKSIGADRGHLMRQFWGEALMTTLIALVVGWGVAETFRPLFNEFAGANLTSLVSQDAFWFGVVLCVLVGLSAGSYPAAILSRFRPAEVLKGNLKIVADRSLARTGLVTLQFSVSVFLIAATLTMGRQFAYIQGKALGFARDHVVVVPMAIPASPDRRIGDVIRDGLVTASVIQEELETHSGIVSTASAGNTFGEPWTTIGFKDAAGRYYEARMNVVDQEYLTTMAMTMAMGRGFSPDVPSDLGRAVVVNEALVREYGIEEPIGARLPGVRFPDHEIIGVVKDFNFESLHGTIRPLILTQNPDIAFEGASDVSFESFPMPKLLLRIRPNQISETLATIEKTWKTVVPEQEFGFSFLDDAIDAQYRKEKRLAEVVQIASALAILIACLGLFGLSGLTVLRRTKEIGVRKVLGASPLRIFWLLAKDFGWIVVAAAIIATPVTFLVMDRWLRDFAYRIELTPDLFALAGLLVAFVALATVAQQGIRAARMDPATSLKYE